MSTPGAEEVAGLHLLGAGDNAGLVVLAPLADLAVAKAELAEAADEAGRHFLKVGKRKKIGEIIKKINNIASKYFLSFIVFANGWAG